MIHLVHGRRYAYTVLGCRCPICRKENAEYQRRWQARRRAKAKAPLSEEPPPKGGYLVERP